MADEMAPPLAVRFSEEAMELMRFAVSTPGSPYASLADFVREAVEAHIARERVREKYEVVRRALSEMEGGPEGKAEPAGLAVAVA